MLANAKRAFAEQQQQQQQLNNNQRDDTREIGISQYGGFRSGAEIPDSQSEISFKSTGKFMLPTTPSRLNAGSGARQRVTKPFKQPLKRSSSSFSTLSNGSDSSKSRKFSSSHGKQNHAPAPSGQGTGRLDRLHSDLSFDENDFVEESTLLTPSAKSAIPPHTASQDQAQQVSYPTLPSPQPRYPNLPSSNHLSPHTPAARDGTSPKCNESSAPLPWSSSPEHHRVGFLGLGRIPSSPSAPTRDNSGKRALLGRQLPSGDSAANPNPHLVDDDLIEARRAVPAEKLSSAAAPDLAIAVLAQGNGKELGDKDRPIRLDSSPPTAVTKRSILPWAQTDAGHEDPEPRPETQTGSKRMKRTKKEKTVPDSTPQTKQEIRDAQLWEQTASAVKAEQKKLRQQNQGTSHAKTKARPVNTGDTAEAVSETKPQQQSRVAAPFLSEEQQRVLNLVVEKKKSVFFTGSAGTGKSVLMREIISKLRKKYERSQESVAVTASTGLAACNIGGNTLHSFAGIGLGRESAEQLIKKIKKNSKALQRWQRTKVLIIDEISMIDGTLFDKLEQIARVIRKKPQAFGGIQLVITGDFFQLPPVHKGQQTGMFSFEASCWKTTIDHTIGLTHVFRQKDPAFAEMLNEMRVGKLTPSSIQAFRKLTRPIKADFMPSTDATELFPTRKQVDDANTIRMSRLGGSAVQFPAIDGGMMKDEEARAKLLENCMAPKQLTLKKGAQVMLIKNIDDTLVNGSIGRVTGFMDEKTFEYYDEHEEEFTGSGAVLDEEGNPTGAANFNAKKYMNSGAGNVSPKFPVVRFSMADGVERELLCSREQWKIEQPNGEVLASRSQVPLILAWALSIHKAQGQTLDKVKVDLGRSFVEGQAYVALSRATTQDGLQVMNFDPSKVMAHARVRSFYDTLYGVETIGGMPRQIAAPAKASSVATTTSSTTTAAAATTLPKATAFPRSGASLNKPSASDAAIDLTFTAEDEAEMMAMDF